MIDVEHLALLSLDFFLFFSLTPSLCPRDNARPTYPARDSDVGPGSNKWKFGFGVSSAAKKREIPACRGSVRPQAGVKANLAILGAAGSTSSPAREAKEGVGKGF